MYHDPGSKITIYNFTFHIMFVIFFCTIDYSTLSHDRLSTSLFRLPVLKCQRHRGIIYAGEENPEDRDEEREDYLNNGSPNKDLANFTELYNSDVN